MRFSFLLTLVLLSACATKTKQDSSFIAIPPVINEKANKVLSPEEVNYDLEQLIYALENAYSGSVYLPPGEFNKLLTQLSLIRGSKTAKELCVDIDTLMEQVSDNHLNAKFENKVCVAEKAPRKASVGKNYFASKVKSPRQSEPVIPWDVRLQKKKNAGAALLISITSFPKETSPVWNGFLEKVKKLLPQANLVILDMRGNGGGDDGFGAKLSDLLAGAPLKSPYKPQWTSKDPAAFQLFVNTFEYWDRLNQKEKKPTPQYITDLKKEFADKLEKAKKGENPPFHSSENKEKYAFNEAVAIKKPIYILIDADCASSCESTTDFFENNPYAQTVGESTAGYVHFGNNGNVILKNSGVVIQMAISFNSYQDNRFIEKKGIAPKIPVPAGQDAMNAAWTHFVAKNQDNQRF